MKATTKVTPNELIFGTSVNHDFQFLIKPEAAKSDKTHHETINELLLVQEKLIKIARDNQHEHDVYVVAKITRSTAHNTFPDKFLCVSKLRNTKRYEITYC